MHGADIQQDRLFSTIIPEERVPVVQARRIPWRYPMVLDYVAKKNVLVVHIMKKEYAQGSSITGEYEAQALGAQYEAHRRAEVCGGHPPAGD